MGQSQSRAEDEEAYRKRREEWLKPTETRGKTNCHAYALASDPDVLRAICDPVSECAEVLVYII